MFQVRDEKNYTSSLHHQNHNLKQVVLQRNAQNKNGKRKMRIKIQYLKLVRKRGKILMQAVVQVRLRIFLRKNKNMIK